MVIQIDTREHKWERARIEMQLNKLGVKFSDGVSFLADNKELTKYAEGLGKPCLQPVGTEDYGIHYPTFYDTIWNIGRTDVEEEG